MFIVRAEFREDLEIGARVERVRAFLGDPQTFARLMPGVESISEEDGAALWAVCAEVPLIGALRGQFALKKIDDSTLRVEWGPTASGEKENLLRYAISFEERKKVRTLVKVALRVELRRRRATELHLMAGLVGERRISAGVQERVTEMMKSFLTRARVELES